MIKKIYLSARINECNKAKKSNLNWKQNKLIRNQFSHFLPYHTKFPLKLFPRSILVEASLSSQGKCFSSNNCERTCANSSWYQNLKSGEQTRFAFLPKALRTASCLNRLGKRETRIFMKKNLWPEPDIFVELTHMVTKF